MYHLRTDETWKEAFEHLDAGGYTSELVTKLHLPVDVAERIAKKHAELKNVDAKTPSTDKKTEDVYVRKLERQVHIAELRRRKAEVERPLEMDKKLADLTAALGAMGSLKQSHCNHMKDGYCFGWQWLQKPSAAYQVGEPLEKSGKWYIRPAYTICATCHAFQQQGTTDLRSLELRLNEMWKTLDETLTFNLREKFQCSICGSKKLVAANIKCTKCGHETWWGWYPPAQ